MFDHFLYVYVHVVFICHGIVYGSKKTKMYRQFSPSTFTWTELSHQACEASTVTFWAIPLTLDHWFDPWEPYSGRRKWKSWKNTNLIQMFLIYSEVHIDSVHPKLKTSKVKHALKTLISYKKLHGVLWLCCLSYPHDCVADWKQKLLMLLVLGGTVVLNVEKEWK